MAEALDLLRRLMTLLRSKHRVQIVQAPPSWGNSEEQIRGEFESVGAAMDEATELLLRRVDAMEAPPVRLSTSAEAAKILRGWAKAYRDSLEHRFPSDPDAEFFPVDLENAANLLARVEAGAKPDAMREARIAKASTLARRLCQLFDSGGESQRTARARHASAIFQLLGSHEAEQRQCDADPVCYLERCERLALAAPVPSPDGAAEASEGYYGCSLPPGACGCPQSSRRNCKNAHWVNEHPNAVAGRAGLRAASEMTRRNPPPPSDDVRSALADALESAAGCIASSHAMPGAYAKEVLGKIEKAQASLRSAPVSGPEIADERVKQLAARLIGYVQARPDYSYDLLLAHVTETIFTFVYNEILNHRKATIGVPAVGVTRELYSALWNIYIANNPDLLFMIIDASGLSDMFGREGHCCQATELWRIRCQAIWPEGDPKAQQLIEAVNEIYGKG